jgi:hypothetical protein
MPAGGSSRCSNRALDNCGAADVYRSRRSVFFIVCRTMPAHRLMQKDSGARLANIPPLIPKNMAPAECVVPGELWRLEIRHLSFRYADNVPYLSQGFSLRIEPGKVVTNGLGAILTSAATRERLKGLIDELCTARRMGDRMRAFLLRISLHEPAQGVWPRSVIWKLIEACKVADI